MRHQIFKQFTFTIILTCLFFTTPATSAKPYQLPVDLFADRARLEDPQLSVDGSRLAYLFRKDAKEIVVIQNLNTKKQMGVPMVADANIRWLRWANKDVLLVAYWYESSANSFRRQL